MTRGFDKIGPLLRSAIICLFLSASTGLATVTITSATNGTSISADKAASAISPAWTSLGAITIREGNKFDFSTGTGVTLVLKTPAGFEYNTSTLPNITFTSGGDISSASVSFSNSTTLTITMTVSGTGGTDQLTIGNTNAIQVRPTTGSPLASGQIFRPQSGGGTATINGITTSANADGSGGSNFGSLSEVAGAVAKLAFSRDPAGATVGIIFGTQPIVKTQDQFGNNSTTGLAVSNVVSVALSSGTGPLLGTTNLNIGTGSGTGTVTYTNPEIDAGGTNKQLTASAPGLTSGLSGTFTVNSPPSISNIPNLTTNEDKVALTSFTISDLETPADSLILSASSSNINLVPNTNIVFSGTGNNRNLAITPLTNAFGTSTITVSVSDGVLSTNTSFLLTMNQVNDPPTMNALANLTILEDTNTQTINLTGISPGPSLESTQTVTITASSSNPSLIANPTVNYTNPNTTGTLTFVPLTNQFGTATITVIVRDNGGTANGGGDSLTNSFVGTVLAVNDAPTLDPLNDVLLSPNAGLQTVALTGISPGPSNESTQTVTLTASSSNPGLIPTPTINYSNPNSSGSLTFTPVGNASGSAVITVTNKDNGGTANGGQDTIIRQFTVTVSPLSDLGISQVAIPNPAFMGGTITFKLTVTNSGPTTATAIQVTNTLPSGVDSVSVTSSQGSSINYGSIIVCSLGNLTNGGSATINVNVEPLTADSYTNQASVWSSIADPNPADNSSTTTASVVSSQFAISSTALQTESCTNGVIDPAETVTVSFALQNNSSSNTTNLVATLKTSGGVTLPSGPQNYGVIAAGGAPVSRSFTFTPLGTCGNTFTATLQLQDGVVSLGAASKTLTFGHLANRTTAFTNSSSIAIPSIGTAASYPYTINVSNLNSNLLNATVTLNGITHGRPHDLEILLVGPAGQATWLMSDCGGINTINNITLTFDNAAASGLLNQGQIVSGTFKPTDFSPDDVMPAPAPAGPYVADLSIFNGTDPNGTWQLYIFDDTSGFSGSITAGWTLNLTTMEPACCIDQNSIDVAFAGISAAPNPLIVGNNVTFTVIATNQGPATATGVMLTNPIPANTLFVSASSSQGTCTTNGNNVVCSLGTLTNTASAAMSVTFQTTQPGTLTNTASISANQPDRVLSNNAASGTAVITVPSVTIGDATVLEGNSGTTTNAVFILQLSAVSSQTISVNYATTDITATGGSDYVATNGTVVFTPGQTAKTVVVTVLGDNLSEATEFFGVALSNPTNVTLGNVQGTGTIVDDDPLPTLSINDASVVEGNSGTTNMLFTVSVSPVSGQAITLNFATANGSALAGSDYLATNGSMVINAGLASQAIAVPVIGDTLNESNETFFVNVSGVVNASVGRAQATGTIINDDFLASISAASATLVTETCSPANGVIDAHETVTVRFGLRNISAGNASTTNLVATLLQTGGVVAPSGPQNYGALTAGGPAVSNSFTFTANGTCGDTLVAVLQLQDGASNLGMVTNLLPTGRTGFVTNSFTNSNSVTIPDFGTASPYPSTINIASGLRNITRLTATLSGLSHTYPSDLEILLVGSGGQQALLMSDAGDGMAISNVTLTFDDAASVALPVSSQIASGTYKPTDYPPNDSMPPPAPAQTYGTNLSVFNGTDPTGTWSLYVYDDSVGDAGSVSSWRLTLTTVGPAICCGNNSAADLALGMTSSTNVSRVGSNVTYTINVTNRGPDAASDVVLTDNLPSSLVFLSVNTPVGTWSINGGVVTFNLGPITNSARATITITEIGTAQGIMTNTATISARTGDPNPGNSAATNALPVLPPAPVALFSATPVIGAWPLSVNFTDSSSGAITNRAWDFGNGATTNTAQTSFAVT